MAPVSIPIFREFKHPELLKVKLPNSEATRKDLEQLVKNTNALISKGLHTPGYRLTHGGEEDKKKSLGWIEKLELADDGRVIGYSEFTSNGKDLIRNKEVRWVSSGIRRDFRLTGEPDGPVLPGLYLDHVAVLGAENPAIKGLVDLSRVELAEGTSVRPGSESFSINEEAGEVCYFSEYDFRKEIRAMEKEKEDNVSMAMFKELQTKIENMGAAVTAEKTRADKAEADLKALREQSTQAQFAEYQGAIKPEIKKIQEKFGLGAEFSDKMTAVGEALFGTKGLTAFKELLTNLTSAKQAPKKRVLEETEIEVDETADFAEDGSNLSEADLKKAVTDPEMGKTVLRILKFRQKKNPKFSLRDLDSEVRARR